MITRRFSCQNESSFIDSIDEESDQGSERIRSSDPGESIVLDLIDDLIQTEVIHLIQDLTVLDLPGEEELPPIWDDPWIYPDLGRDPIHLERVESADTLDLLEIPGITHVILLIMIYQSSGNPIISSMMILLYQ
jgi:hypothetical protein